MPVRPISYFGHAIFADDFVLHYNMLHCRSNMLAQVNGLALGTRAGLSVNGFGIFVVYILGLRLFLRG